ncbi:uncharacterized protein LOC129913983 [Episyrphus balteatus]|uniref:uncharacterized protein LOC129913983 n=1 Tax=Episyrphus balteatus TaxID=286459 RepID=UPI0024864F54|nr:uncharacterized protein LOC129913983 [Episyrphus balteatus]
MGKNKKENNKSKPKAGEELIKINKNNEEKPQKNKKKQQNKKVKEAVEKGLLQPPTPVSAAENGSSDKADKQSKAGQESNNKKNKVKSKKNKQQNGKAKEAPKSGEVENPPKAEVDKTSPEAVKQSKKKEKNKLNKKLKKAEGTTNAANVNPGQTIFVGNVPSNTKHVQLLKLFAPFGKVLSVRFRTANGKVIFKHKMRKQSAALNAYIVFDSVESADKALELNGSTFKEHHLRVQKSENVKDQSNSKNTIFVGNLKSTTTDDSLHQIFSSCGEIEYVRTLQFSEGKGCNGTGYVCFKSPEAVGLALELKGTLLEERPIHVERYSTNKLGAKEKRMAENKTNPKGKPKGKGGKPLEKAASEFRNKKFNGKKNQNKNTEDKKSGDKKKKSEFRGVSAEGAKKKPKKKVQTQMKRLANKIAPRE